MGTWSLLFLMISSIHAEKSLGYVLDNFTIHGHDSVMAQKASLKQLVACLKVLECGFHMYLVTWWGGLMNVGIQL